MPAAVTVQSIERMTHLVASDGHAIVADEPLDTGDDLGMDPYELLLGALGACTAMTLRIYAERKGWPLESVNVRLTHERVHARDCEDCEESSEGYVEVIRRTINVKGALDADQLDRLRYIAARCPVHRTLAAAPQVIDALSLAD